MPLGKLQQAPPPPAAVTDAPRAGSRAEGCAAAPAAGGLRRGRSGIVGVVAMLFLVLFAVLAIGFYAAVTLSAQISANERAIYRSQLAAESGMEYVRFQLASLEIPAHRPPDKVLEELFLQLRIKMCGTENLGTGDVGYDGTTVTLPADPDQFIQLGPQGPGFRAVITQTNIWSDSAPAYRLRVQVFGSQGSVATSVGRGVEIEYEMENSRSAVFDYGVAAVGPVEFKSSPTARLLGTPDAAASVLTGSAVTPAITTGKGEIEGKLYVPMSTSQVSLGGGSVANETNNAAILSQHVHLTAAPEFPTVHTIFFKELATNAYVAGVAKQKNVRVPPNTNPSFSGGDVIDGILYIESPNTVTFSGHTNINGLIVFEDRGSPAQNVLDFKGNVSHSAIPNTAEFAALKARAAGLAIAAPTAAVSLSSSVDSTLTGSIIANKLTLGGSADVSITNGSLITLGSDPVLVEGKAVHVIGTAVQDAPYAGVRFKAHFRPLPSTYREMLP